jgi:hypothetical protein
VTLPATLLLLDWWPLGRLRTWDDLWPRVREKLPLVPLVMASLWITVALEHQGAIGTLDEFSLAARVQNAIVSYATYLWMLVWPVDLWVPYLHRRGGIPRRVAGAATLLAITASAIREREPPVGARRLALVPRDAPSRDRARPAGDQAMADRFTYVPQIGVVPRSSGCSRRAPRCRSRRRQRSCSRSSRPAPASRSGSGGTP